MNTADADEGDNDDNAHTKTMKATTGRQAHYLSERSTLALLAPKAPLAGHCLVDKADAVPTPRKGTAQAHAGGGCVALHLAATVGLVALLPVAP